MRSPSLRSLLSPVLLLSPPLPSASLQQQPAHSPPSLPLPSASPPPPAERVAYHWPGPKPPRCVLKLEAAAFGRWSGFLDVQYRIQTYVKYACAYGCTVALPPPSELLDPIHNEGREIDTCALSIPVSCRARARFLTAWNVRAQDCALGALHQEVSRDFSIRAGQRRCLGERPQEH